MECPYCGEELEHEDTFGNTDYCLGIIGYIGDGFYTKRYPEKYGDIYQCENEECEMYQEYFYTIDNENNNELHEGYPC